MPVPRESVRGWLKVAAPVGAAAWQEYNIQLIRSAMGKIEGGIRNVPAQEKDAVSMVLDVSLEWLVRGGDWPV